MTARIFSDDEIKTMREQFGQGQSLPELAEEYEKLTDRSHASKIIRGVMYSDAPGPTFTKEETSRHKSERLRKFDANEVNEMRDIVRNSSMTISDMEEEFEASRFVIRQALLGINVYEGVGEGPLSEEEVLASYARANGIFSDNTDEEARKILSSTPLNEKQREVLFFREIHGASYEKIAAILDIPMGTVKSALSRGRDRVRKARG